MKNTDLLKKLYELQSFTIRNEELKKYISDWIFETQLDIADESIANIGYGSEMKTYRKWLKLNRKKLPCMGGVVSLEKHKNIIGTRYYAVCLPSTKDLPQMFSEESKQQARVLLAAIDNAQIGCTKKTYVPSRAELDAIIKTHKALPRKERGDSRALYHFMVSDGVMISVDAEYLMDMLAVFPSGQCWYDPKRKSMSPIYFAWAKARGVLYPVRVKNDYEL